MPAASFQSRLSARKCDGDVATRAQPHLDAVFDGVPPGDVLEVVDVEAFGVEFGPQHLDEVAVELGGDPGTVVIGRDEARRRLDQVGAEEEVIAEGEGRPRSGSEIRRRSRSSKLPMVPPRKITNRSPGRPGRVPIRLVEVGDHGMHRHGG